MFSKGVLLAIVVVSIALIIIFLIKYYLNQKELVKLDKETEEARIKLQEMRKKEEDKLIEDQMASPIVYDDRTTEEVNDICEEQEEKTNIETEPVIALKEDKVSSNFKYEHKSGSVLLFNNIGTPSILLLDYDKGILKGRYDIDLSGFNLEQGLVANIEGLAAKINEVLPSINTLDILLSVEECFRNIVSLPKMTKAKAKKLYAKEIKDDFPKFNDQYITFEHEYEHKLGTVFYTYFVPSYIINYFKKLTKLLNAKTGLVDLWGNYLFNNVASVIKDDFTLIYVYNNFATLINSFDGKLVSFHSFKCESEKDIKTEFLASVAKHEFELEKRLIKNYIYISNVPYDISEVTNSLNELHCSIDLEHYHVKGIKL